MTQPYWPELDNYELISGDYGVGYYNVYVKTDNRLIMGYIFAYIYGDGECIYSISLPHLRKRVLEMGYEWKVINVNVAMNMLTLNMLDLCERNFILAEHL